MAAITPPILIESDTPDADQWRMANDALAYFPGVKAGAGLLVTQRAGGANMSVDVAGGFVIVPGGENAYQGAYYCENQGVTNVPITTADPSFARSDLIVARVDDSNYSGAVRTFSIDKVTGVATGGAPIPATPPNCWVLAVVLIGSGQATITNAAITDSRFGSASFTGEAGQAMLLGGATFYVPSRPRTFRASEGLIGFETANDRVFAHDGTNWTNRLLFNGTFASWTALTYLSSWADWGAPYATGRYRKVDDRVQIRALIKFTTVLATPSTIATLPAGFRPAEDLVFMVESGGGPDRPSRIEIHDTGNIILAGVASVASDAAAFTTLKMNFAAT